MKNETKHFHATLKAQNKEKRKIKGFASTKNVDRQGEIVDPSALKESMKEFMSLNPILLFMHDHKMPIGSVTKFEPVPDGLIVEAEIAKGDEHADRVWNLINQGILKTFSIGFIPKKIEFDLDDDTPTIKDLEMLEISVVSIPANREAVFSMAKSMKFGSDTIDMVEPAFKGLKDSMKKIESLDLKTIDDDFKLKLKVYANDLSNLAVKASEDLELEKARDEIKELFS